MNQTLIRKINLISLDKFNFLLGRCVLTAAPSVASLQHTIPKIQKLISYLNLRTYFFILLFMRCMNQIQRTKSISLKILKLDGTRCGPQRSPGRNFDNQRKIGQWPLEYWLTIWRYHVKSQGTSRFHR